MFKQLARFLRVDSPSQRNHINFDEFLKIVVLTILATFVARELAEVHLPYVLRRFIWAAVSSFTFLVSFVYYLCRGSEPPPQP